MVLEAGVDHFVCDVAALGSQVEVVGHEGCQNGLDLFLLLLGVAWGWKSLEVVRGLPTP